MAHIKPFCSIRPKAEFVKEAAALPYDVYNREEAVKAVKGHPLSFLNIDRAETQFDASVDTYDDRVYEKAKELLEERLSNQIYIKEEMECYYIYELIMNGRSQSGIVACASIDDYLNSMIKKHEKTREEKELDRIRHVDCLNTQTGPIFLAYRSNRELRALVKNVQKDTPLYDFISEDGITHRIWRICDPALVESIRVCFENMKDIYIADGHHRAASAVKVGCKRRAEHAGYTGEEEFNYFLSVLFPEDELMILPYNRVVKDMNGNTIEEFLKKLNNSFEIERKQEAFSPQQKGCFAMYMDGQWYQLRIKEGIVNTKDPVKQLDVSVLQDYLLGPILGIGDPRVDQRIDFVGGIRGLNELERRADSDMCIAFSVYPTSIQELFAVSDAGLLMPPKSTWFEPKLRSGIFLHSLI